VGNNLVTGTVDTTRTIQNINLKSRIRVPKQAIVFNLGYNIPWINNNLVRSDFWNKKMGTGIEFSVDFRQQFQKRKIENNEVVFLPTALGLSAGLGISHFRQAAVLEDFTESLANYTDADGDRCTVILDYKGVKEKAALTYLDIPVYLEIGKPSRVKVSGYCKLGFKASILIGKNSDGEGTYTSTGYYPKPQWDVTLFDIPHLGYYTDALCYNDPELKPSPFVLWGSVAGGVNFPFSSLEKNKLAKWIFRLSAKVDYSLTPVSKAMEESYFKGSTFRLNQSNMLGGDGSRIFSVGLSVGFIYCM
jgi:hypothetical protein